MGPTPKPLRNVLAKTSYSTDDWAYFESGTTNKLNSVFFTDEYTGFVVGENGIILKTTCAGEFIPIWVSASPSEAQTFTEGPFPMGSTVTLKANANQGYRFLNWTEDEKIVSTDSVYEFISTTPRFIVANYVQVTGVDEHKILLKVYPNPATNKITISTPDKSQGETQVSIFNINGKLIQRDKFQNTDRYEMVVSKVAKGIYLLRIQSNEGVETQKLVLQ